MLPRDAGRRAAAPYRADSGSWCAYCEAQGACPAVYVARRGSSRDSAAAACFIFDHCHSAPWAHTLRVAGPD